MPSRIRASRCGRVRAQRDRKAARRVRRHVEVASAQGADEAARDAEWCDAMTCQDYDAHIDDYVDDALSSGVLSDALRAECEAHVSTCTNCRALTTDLRAIRVATRNLEPQVPSPQVWYRIAAAIEAEPRGIVSAWFGGWQQAVAGAVAVVLIVSSLSWVGGHLTPGGRTRITPPVSDAGPAPPLDATEFTLVEQQYTTAIAGLEDITM